MASHSGLEVRRTDSIDDKSPRLESSVGQEGIEGTDWSNHHPSRSPQPFKVMSRPSLPFPLTAIYPKHYPAAHPGAGAAIGSGPTCITCHCVSAAYTGHFGSPSPFGSPVFAKLVQYFCIAVLVCWSSGRRGKRGRGEKGESLRLSLFSLCRQSARNLQLLYTPFLDPVVEGAFHVAGDPLAEGV
jgi:hypothetical protein